MTEDNIIRLLDAINSKLDRLLAFDLWLETFLSAASLSEADQQQLTMNREYIAQEG